MRTLPDLPGECPPLMARPSTLFPDALHRPGGTDPARAVPPGATAGLWRPRVRAGAPGARGVAWLAATVATLFLAAGCDRPPPPQASSADAGASAESRVLSGEYALAFRQIEQGQFAAARLRARRLLAAAPDDGVAEFLIGLSLHREKRSQAALPHLLAATRSAPHFSPGWYFLGWAAFQAGDPALAETAFRRHLDLDADAADTHFALALVALERDGLDEAERLLHASIRLIHEAASRRQGTGAPAAGADSARDEAKARVRLADIHLLRGDAEAARGELLQAVALYPDHYESHYKLARVLTRLGDEAGAAAAMSTFERLRARHYPPTGPEGAAATRFPE